MRYTRFLWGLKRRIFEWAIIRVGFIALALQMFNALTNLEIGWLFGIVVGEWSDLGNCMRLGGLHADCQINASCEELGVDDVGIIIGEGL